jgi:hypothetical protein
MREKETIFIIFPFLLLLLHVNNNNPYTSGPNSFIRGKTKSNHNNTHTTFPLKSKNSKTHPITPSLSHAFSSSPTTNHLSP